MLESKLQGQLDWIHNIRVNQELGLNTCHYWTPTVCQQISTFSFNNPQQKLLLTLFYICRNWGWLPKVLSFLPLLPPTLLRAPWSWLVVSHLYCGWIFSRIHFVRKAGQGLWFPFNRWENSFKKEIRANQTFQRQTPVCGGLIEEAGNLAAEGAMWGAWPSI